MLYTARWTCPECGRELGTVRPNGGLDLDEPKRVAVDPRGPITVTCADCKAERTWTLKRPA